MTVRGWEATMDPNYKAPKLPQNSAPLPPGAVHRSMADRPGLNDPHTLRRDAIYRLIEEHGEPPVDDDIIDKLTDFADHKNCAVWELETFGAGMTWLYELTHWLSSKPTEDPDTRYQKRLRWLVETGILLSEAKKIAKDEVFIKWFESDHSAPSPFAANVNVSVVTSTHSQRMTWLTNTEPRLTTKEAFQVAMNHEFITWFDAHATKEWLPAKFLPSTAMQLDEPTEVPALRNWRGSPAETMNKVRFLMKENELLTKFAEALEQIYDNRTAGDYTFYGVLATFANEWENAREGKGSSSTVR